MIGRSNIILKRNGQLELHFLSSWDVALFKHGRGPDEIRRLASEAAKDWEPDEILEDHLEVDRIKTATSVADHPLAGDITLILDFMEGL